MGETTNIGWTDKTFNGWIGCTEMTPACDNCYARELNERYGWALGWGAGVSRYRTKPASWNKVRSWDRKAAKLGVRYRVFSHSLADWQDQEVPEEWRTDLEALIDETPNLDWLLLSKRHGPTHKWCTARDPKPNVRIGFTVEDQERADMRLPYLRGVFSIGWQTFVSYEPALGPIEWGDLYGIDWLICGAESGAHHRPFDMDWARQCRDSCQEFAVPFFFKQTASDTGKAIHAPELDGRTWTEYPLAA